MSFNEKYKKIKQLVQPELDIIKNSMVYQIEMREPLNSYIKNFLQLPSKRIRSVLALLFIKAIGEEVKPEHYSLLTAVELTHNASLFHDDVIDNSSTRRSHKTLSEEFDNKLAIISGDYLLSKSMRVLILANAEKDLIKDYIETIEKMCIGEINQNFDRFKICTIEDYIEKTKNKTANLFDFTLNWCNKLLNKPISSDFALDFGIAFQIRDDLLNILCVDDSKPENNDIKDGIYTAPVIFAGNIDNYQSGIEKTRDLLNNYIKSAKNKLNNLPKNEYSEALLELLELLKNE